MRGKGDYNHYNNNDNLHQAQSHQILRAWQSQRNDVNHPIDFVLPLFICQDDEAIEEIDSMPGVNRYGADRVLEYLEPLVEEYSLSSVLLFPVASREDVAEVKQQVEMMDKLSPRIELVGNSSTSDDDATSSRESSSNSNSSMGSRDDTVDQNHHGSATSKSRNIKVLKTRSKVIYSEDMDQLLLSESPSTNVIEANRMAMNSVVGEPNSKTVEPPPPATRDVGPGCGSMSIHERSESSLGSNESDWNMAKEIELVKMMALQECNNPLLRLLPKLRAKYPNLLLICDVCLCAFTSTGHCCFFEDQLGNGHKTAARPNSGSDCMSELRISNELTCAYLAKLAVRYAQMGCHVVAPSDMMDGRIGLIRRELDKNLNQHSNNNNKLSHVSIMSYSAKFASAFYGPFRQATNNSPEFGDRRTYQLPAGSRTLALRAVQRDIEEGADFIMVKPALSYLDIVRDISNRYPQIPLAIYQVSGEYSMLKLAAKQQLIDYKRAVNETLTSFRRSGASILITYFTPEILRGELCDRSG